VTDGTLGLLSRSLPSSKTPLYNSNTLKDTKPRQTSSHGSHPSFSSPSQNYPTDPNNPPPYVPPAQIHQQTPYPAATQYNTYPESTSSQNLTYTPSSNYPTYSASSHDENIEAPLLAAFAAQASQLPQQPNYAPNSVSSAWQQYTMTMAGGLEPQEQLFSASALMQLQGGRELNGDISHDNDLAVTSSMTGGHLGGPVSGSLGGTWPLNIFDIGQGS